MSARRNLITRKEQNPTTPDCTCFSCQRRRPAAAAFAEKRDLTSFLPKPKKNKARMNVINAVLAAAPTNSPRSNGSAATHHQQTAGQSNSTEGYTALAGQGSSSCSSSTVSSSSLESEDRQRRHSRLSFPVEESSSRCWSQEHVSPFSSKEAVSEELDAAAAASTSYSDKTDCKYSNRGYNSVDGGGLSSSASSSGGGGGANTSSSSLDLSNPNINSEVGQYSSGEFTSRDRNYLYSVQSLEHDLDCILENRDLNPFYEEMLTTGGDLKDLPESACDDECEFNVEDYLVDLDQYLDEQEQKSTTTTTTRESDQSASGGGTLDRRILRQPNTNRTLPRNLRDNGSSSSRLKRESDIRNSVHLGKGPTGKTIFCCCHPHR